MPGFRFSAVAAATAAMIGALVPLRPAAADPTLTVTEVGLLNGYETVDINTGSYAGTVDGVYAGQQELLVTASSDPSLVGQTLFAWCVDWGQDIYIGSSGNQYSLSQFTTPPTKDNSVPPIPGGLSQSMLNELNWLSSYGNYLLSIVPTNDLSAAVQIAMWNVEYGFNYADDGSGDPNLQTEVNYLLNGYQNGTIDWQTPQGASVLYSDSIQNLNVFVPEPSSLALLCAGLLGLGGLSLVRRRA